MEAHIKPQCGGRGLDPDAYDLPLHIFAVFIVMFQSTLGCGFPVIAKRVSWLRIPPPVFFFCKHFGTGVLIATAFVHLLPTAFGSLNDPCLPALFNEIYPATPGAIIMLAMFALFTIELWLHSSGNNHDHGGATGKPTNTVRKSQISNPTSERPIIKRVESTTSFKTIEALIEKEPQVHIFKTPKVPNTDYSHSGEPDDNHSGQVPAWFVSFYNHYLSQIGSLQTALSDLQQAKSQQDPQMVEIALDNCDINENDLEQQDPHILRKMSLNITLLECGILFHSIFIGMTLSVTSDGFLVFLIAILFHQTFEGLGLGSRIASVPYPQKSIRPWVLCLAFGLTTPIGQVIGLVMRNSYDPASAFALILIGVFNAISSGLLIFAALVDLLAEDFLSHDALASMSGNKRSLALSFVLLGAIGMSIVGAFA